MWFRDAGVSRARSPGCYCTAFSTAYVRRRCVVEIKFGSVCCAWVLLYRENTVNARGMQSPGRTDSLKCSGGALQVLAATEDYKRARNSSRGSHWGALTVAAGAVAVSEAEEGSADDVVWGGRCAGQQHASERLALVRGLVSWTAGEALETAGCTRGRYFAETKRLFCAEACTASTFSWSGASLPVRLRDFQFPSLFEQTDY